MLSSLKTLVISVSDLDTVMLAVIGKSEFNLFQVIEATP